MAGSVCPQSSQSVAQAQIVARSTVGERDHEVNVLPVRIDGKRLSLLSAEPAYTQASQEFYIASVYPDSLVVLNGANVGTDVLLL